MPDRRAVDTLTDLLGADDLVAVLADETQLNALRQSLERLAHSDLEVAMIAGGGGLYREFRGVDGFLEAWADWLAPFASYRAEVEPEVRGVGDAFVLFSRQSGELAGGGAVTAPGAAVVRFRDELIERIEFHLDRGEALRSAGLEG